MTLLNYQRMEAGKKLKNIAPATIERRGDKLHISGEVITIHQALVPDDVGKHELDYIRALYEAYAQKLNRETFFRIWLSTELSSVVLVIFSRTAFSLV